MKLTNFAISKSLTVFVLIALLVFGGITAYVQMPREAAPDITIPYIMVQTLYFGVSPSDMETLVTNEMESKLKGIADVKEITSTSGDSYSLVVIEFIQNVDIDDALQKVKDKVDEAKSELPADAEDPVVFEINFSDMPVLVMNIAGDYSEDKLKKIAEDLQDQIQTVTGVLDVQIAGGLDREVHIIADQNKLNQYNLGLTDISKTIKNENMNLPGGDVKIGKSNYLLRIPGEFKKISQIKDLIISENNGKPVYLRDVAKVADSYKEKETYSRYNGRNSISISVQKRSGENIVRVCDDIKDIVSEFKSTFPSGTELDYITDYSEEILDMVTELENSIMLGMFMIVAVLFLFMGFRNAMFVGIALPLSMLVSFIVLHYILGITLSMVTLFGLILALGMLVDNAIVIVENIYRYLEEGHNRVKAAKLATAEVAWPVIASTATTIAAFVSLLYMPGIMGEFMKFIPICVITTISSSLFVALIINPVICASFLKKKIKHVHHNKKWEKFVGLYKIALIKAIKHKKTTIFLSIFTFIFSIVLFMVANGKFEFFPSTTPTEIYVDIHTKTGSNIEHTNLIAEKIENILQTNLNIKKVVSTIGVAGESSKNNDSSYARIIAVFNEGKERIESPLKTIDWIRDFTSKIPGIEVTVAQDNHGPPTGEPINIQISGSDFSVLLKISEDIKNVMNSINGIVDIKDNYDQGKTEIIVNVNREQATRLGTSTAQIASTIRTAVKGEEISTFREFNEEYDIILRLKKEQRNDLAKIEQLLVAGNDGMIPILNVADIKIEKGIGTIKHLDSKKLIEITADVSSGSNANQKLNEIKKILSKKDFPSGYFIKYGGENEDMQIMADYLNKAFVFAIFLIGMILISQFNSIFIPIVIISSVFLSLIGIFLGLVFFNKPFGIVMTGIGVISLAGVVVNNAIVLVDYITQLRKEGMDREEAIITAGTVRLRPVLLTALTTILGLFPMSFGINYDFKNLFNNLFNTNIFSNLINSFVIGGESTEMWGSMGSALTIGLIVGTILTLIVLPSIYIAIDDLMIKIRKK